MEYLVKVGVLEVCRYFDARFPTEFQKVVHIYGILSKEGSLGGLVKF
jgi:hypothetical protein